MKTNLPLPSILRRSLLPAALAAIAISTSSGPALALTNTPTGTSPAGVWDCVMSGVRTGVACLIFSNDFTFSAYEVLVPNGPKLPSTSSANNSRGPNTGIGRAPGTSSSDTNTGPAGTPIYGFEVTTNNWTYDSQGRVFGFFAETAGGPCTTNFVVVTNLDLTVTTNPVITCASLTNSISFTAKVVPGKRIVMTCSTPSGKVVFRGVPAATLSDYSGNWYGIKRQKQPPVFNELFSMAPSLDFPQVPNLYDVFGMGPGYQYLGRALISSKSRMGFECFIGTDPASASVRAVTGQFNLNRARGTLGGWDQPSGVFTNHVTFRVVKQ